MHRGQRRDEVFRVAKGRNVLSDFSHSSLGVITDEVLADLHRLASGISPQKLGNRYSSDQMAVMRDIATLQAKAIHTLGETARPDENDQSKAGALAWAVTRQGLQQSTLSAVAAWKASRFDGESVVDVCCGLGSDLIALAAQLGGKGRVTGIDFNSDVLAMTQANVRAAGQVADLQAIDVVAKPIHQFVPADSLLHIDPDRRVDGKRHTRPEDLVPDWERVRALLSGCRGGVVKLAPATLLTDTQASDVHRTWISASGSVREQSVFVGDLLTCTLNGHDEMKPGGRSVVSIRGGVASTFTAGAAPQSPTLAPTKALDTFIVDLDPSIRAAGLTEFFAETSAIRPVDLASGFMTSGSIDKLKDHHAMVTTAKVLEVVGCDDRKLRRCFRALDAYPAVIKVRGADQNPEKLSRRLKDCGATPLGLWIGRNGKRTFAAITELSERHGR